MSSGICSSSLASASSELEQPPVVVVPDHHQQQAAEQREAGADGVPATVFLPAQVAEPERQQQAEFGEDHPGLADERLRLHQLAEQPGALVEHAQGRNGIVHGDLHG
ncbi:hypothetical protein [Pseudomonas aeruginosa]|uniref:hypothetical protein n=1 Tax=Pseudomonas aeruginosa TaxID=287 RepID=UPI003EE0AAAE